VRGTPHERVLTLIGGGIGTASTVVLFVLADAVNLPVWPALVVYSIAWGWKLYRAVMAAAREGVEG
jgi:hypothetical protein